MNDEGYSRKHFVQAEAPQYVHEAFPHSRAICQGTVYQGERKL